MKECDITRDLLFGYNDDTLYPGSKDFVEEHLKNCENCKRVFDEIKKDENEINDKTEIDYLKKINKKDKKKNIIISILLVIVIIIICISIVSIINYINKANSVEIFLEDNIGDANIESIKEAIKEKDENAEIIYYSKEEGLEKMKLQFDDKTLLEGYSKENNPFPASLVVKTEFYKTKEIKEYIQGIEGVKSVTRVTLNPYELLFAEIYKHFIQ